MPEIIGFRNIDDMNVEPTGSAAPAVGAPNPITALTVEPPAAVAPVVEAAAIEVAATEAKKDEVEAPKVEEKDEDESTSDEKYFEHEGVKYIKAEDVKGIVQKRVGRLNQEKIQTAAAELAKDALNSKKLLENDNKELKRENEVLKLSKGDQTRFEILNDTGLSGEALKKLAERLGDPKPNNDAEKEFREKITEKPKTGFNLTAVMNAAKEGRK